MLETARVLATFALNSAGFDILSEHGRSLPRHRAGVRPGVVRGG